jgi:hypothetical protein
MQEKYISRPHLAKRHNVSLRTAKRRERAKVPGYDAPVVIRNRVFYDLAKVEAAELLGFIPEDAA